MNTPRTIREYLEQLRSALAGADPALVQDALYDAEDHLRSELAENPAQSEAEMLARVANSYGAPDEVAAIYVDKEQLLQQALRPPRAPTRRVALGRFFGIAADPRAYAGLIYMLLSLATGGCMLARQALDGRTDDALRDHAQRRMPLVRFLA